MSLAILFHFLCAQHVSDINISIIRSLRLCWWITTSVVLFSVRCVLEFLLRLIFGGVRFAGWSTSASACKTNTTTNITSVISITRWMPASWARLRTYSFTHIFYYITSDLFCLVNRRCGAWSTKFQTFEPVTPNSKTICGSENQKHLWKMNTSSCEAAPLFKVKFLLMASLSYGGEVHLFLQHWN